MEIGDRTVYEAKKQRSKEVKSEDISDQISVIRKQEEELSVISFQLSGGREEGR
jgi:hypothetical protein